MSIKILLGLSGGVDSAVAGFLLTRAGYDVRAVFMLNWKERGSCNWEDDLVSARSVAKFLRIPLAIWDFAKEYQEFVFSDCIALYKKGFTPNPDVFCNKYIKFGALYDRARKAGADYIATGHYARIMEQGSKNKEQDLHVSRDWGLGLFSAIDKTKDQSDFLYQIKPSQLKHVLFPIGGMMKSHVRALARQIGLPNWDRPESMGVCFIGEMNMRRFLQGYIPPKSGDIVTVSGVKLGTHDGVWYYTLGQREGLHIGGTGPYFVVKKDVKRNRIIVAKEPEAGRLLLVKRVILTKVNLFIPSSELRAAKNELRVLWRDRHLSPLQNGILRKVQNGSRWIVDFSKPKRAVTPGQSLVMYALDGERVIGGGVIAKIES